MIGRAGYGRCCSCRPPVAVGYDMRHRPRLRVTGGRVAASVHRQSSQVSMPVVAGRRQAERDGQQQAPPVGLERPRWRARRGRTGSSVGTSPPLIVDSVSTATRAASTAGARCSVPTHAGGVRRDRDDGRDRGLPADDRRRNLFFASAVLMPATSPAAALSRTRGAGEDAADSGGACPWWSPAGARCQRGLAGSVAVGTTSRRTAPCRPGPGAAAERSQLAPPHKPRHDSRGPLAEAAACASQAQ